MFTSRALVLVVTTALILSAEVLGMQLALDRCTNSPNQTFSKAVVPPFVGEGGLSVMGFCLQIAGDASVRV